jgi:integrase
MIAKRTKNLKLGLLPRMDARPRKGGGWTFRYYGYDRRYINLGHDRGEAIRKVLEMERRAPDTGTVAELVREYLASADFKGLGDRTQADYLAYSKHIIKVFGTVQVTDMQPPHIARYLRIERSEAPVQANREIAFLGSCFQFGIENGLALVNPCRQVRRNKERPRSRCPSWEEIASFARTAKDKGPSSHVIGIMAKFIALTGRRRVEFLNLRKTDMKSEGIAIGFAKAKAGEARRQGLIQWDSTLRALFAELESLERKRPDGKSDIPESVFVFTNREGQPYTEQGFKAMWAKIMKDWVALGNERFTFHDLRAYYVTTMVEQDLNPETHANPATTRRIYDRRRTVKIKSSA